MGIRCCIPLCCAEVHNRRSHRSQRCSSSMYHPQTSLCSNEKSLRLLCRCLGAWQTQMMQDMRKVTSKYKEKEDYLPVLKKNYMLIRDHRQLHDAQAMALKEHNKAQKTHSHDMAESEEKLAQANRLAKKRTDRQEAAALRPPARGRPASKPDDYQNSLPSQSSTSSAGSGFLARNMSVPLDSLPLGDDSDDDADDDADDEGAVSVAQRASQFENGDDSNDEHASQFENGDDSNE